MKLILYAGLLLLAAKYEDFYNNLNNSNIELLNTVTVLSTDSTTVDEAVNINYSINDTNTVEYYQKLVNEIYLRTLAVGVDLSESDSSVLDYVTTLPLAVTGSCKYAAAAMIGSEVREQYSQSGMRNLPVENIQEEKPFLFPNPANVSFCIFFDIKRGQPFNSDKSFCP